jgi:hypothetical protein
MENEIFRWFCNSRAKNIALDNHTIKVKADKMTFLMHQNSLFYNGQLTRVLASKGENTKKGEGIRTAYTQ